jgi:rhodanese-related sulfurtransferase
MKKLTALLISISAIALTLLSGCEAENAQGKLDLSAHSKASVVESSELPNPETTCENTAQAVAQGAILIDVREPHEYAEAHLDPAILIPLGTISEEALQAHNIQKDDEIITQCRSGNRSLQAKTILEDLGYTNVKSLAGGITQCPVL